MDRFYWPDSTTGKIVAVIAYGLGLAGAYAVAKLFSVWAGEAGIRPTVAWIRAEYGDTGITIATTASVMLCMLMLFVANRIGSRSK
jgi:hypothetical protein